MENLTTTQLKEQAHKAIRTGDRKKVAALTGEINTRIAAKGGKPVKALPTEPAKVAALKAERAAIMQDAPEVAPAAQQKAKARKPRAITLAPKKEARACKAGTKQARLVDLLSRAGGASMAELREALAPWKDVTIKSGLSWDMNHQKGYGIRTTFENGYQRWLATDYAGMGTFRGNDHPEDVSEADKAALLADNLANGYDPEEVFAVYHLVLPADLSAPIPHTGGAA